MKKLFIIITLLSTVFSFQLSKSAKKSLKDDLELPYEFKEKMQIITSKEIIKSHYKHNFEHCGFHEITLNDSQIKLINAIQAEDMPTFVEQLFKYMAKNNFIGVNFKFFGQFGSRSPIKLNLLRLAVKLNNVEIVKQLLISGAKVEDIYDPCFDNILDWTNSTEMLKLLLSAGANVNRSSYLRYNTFIARVIKNDSPKEVMQLLESHGANTDLLSNDAWFATTALYDAMVLGDLETIKNLLDYGSDINLEYWENWDHIQNPVMQLIKLASDTKTSELFIVGINEKKIFDQKQENFKQILITLLNKSKVPLTDINLDYAISKAKKEGLIEFVSILETEKISRQKNKQ